MTIRIDSRFIYITSIAYIYLSIILFVLSWTRPLIAVPALIMIGISLFLFIRSWVRYSQSNVGEPIRIHITILVIFLLFLALVLYCFGYSGHANQAPDWRKVNAILNDLLTRDWPIYYQNIGEHSMLTYYLGQFLVPALIGRLFNLSFNLTAQVFGVWCYLGYILVYLGFIRVVKASTPAKQLLCTVMFIFFNGLLILAQEFGWRISPLEVAKPFSDLNTYILFSEKGFLLYTSNIMAIQWNPQHCIVPWLIICLFFERSDDVSSFVPLGLPMVFYSGFVFVGFLPFLMVAAIKKAYRSYNLNTVLKQWFSPQNCLMLASFGVVMFVYYLGYIQLDKPPSIGFRVLTFWKESVPLYFIFCFFVFGLDSFFAGRLLRSVPTPPLYIFWCMNVVLLLLPLFQIGLWNDLASRGSMPAIFILMIFVTMGLLSTPSNKSNIITKQILCICVVIGMIYPTLIFARSFASVTTVDHPSSFNTYSSNTLEIYANRSEPANLDFRYNSYTYDVEKSIFYRYFARYGFQQRE